MTDKTVRHSGTQIIVSDGYGPELVGSLGIELSESLYCREVSRFIFGKNGLNQVGVKRKQSRPNRPSPEACDATCQSCLEIRALGRNWLTKDRDALRHASTHHLVDPQTACGVGVER